MGQKIFIHGHEILQALLLRYKYKLGMIVHHIVTLFNDGLMRMRIDNDLE